ncbi:hypothetical protein DFH05DRAFT_1492655 [Lentinula detonsa]|uniref:Fork-head domain-containing protein n=4 Tax=Lentinula TaxID=5352 RepID=A0A9W8TYL3_9AGAR|nr:hypothetical protein DFH05DRAFT_1492655 [Lentinula detonsa]
MTVHAGHYSQTSPSPSGDSESFPDAGPSLRAAFDIPPGTPINLNVLPTPPPGERPAATLETLVQLAIYGSPRGKLTLQEIYAAIEDRFEYFKTTDQKWKGSIRHMLSLKSVFVSTERPPTAPGRGNYWQLDPSVTIKYKRPRKRRSTNRSTHSTRSPSVDSDNSSVQVEEMRPNFPKHEPDATFGLDDVKPDPNASNVYPLTMAAPSEYASSYAYHPKPSPANSFGYDPLVNETGYGQSSALIYPSRDPWLGEMSSPSPDPNMYNNNDSHASSKPSQRPGTSGLRYSHTS